ncbi:MAG: hypothetical protein WBM88_13265 [Woeseiaceae bacterium]
MEILIVFAVLAVALVAPVMLGARLVNARNTGFGSAVLAVVILAALSSGIEGFVANKLVAIVAMVTLGAMVLAGILGTTFLRGLAVSAIATIIQVGVILLLAVAVFGSALPVS